MEAISLATFSQPAAPLATQLVRALRCGDMALAQSAFAGVERAAEAFPTVRAFSALLSYAVAMRDPALLEAKWRQMLARGLAPDVQAHRLRVRGHALVDDLLRTRRAYTDMLDMGLCDHRAVAALVRCAVRCNHLSLATTVMRDAERERGVSLAAGCYNYVLSRYETMGAEGAARLWRLFRRMLDAEDLRLVRPLASLDAGRAVDAHMASFVDLRGSLDYLDGGGHGLQRPAHLASSGKKARKALVNWLTSRAAFPAAPTLFDPNKPDGLDGQKRLCGLVPPPDATTFIIAMRASGKLQQWSSVLVVWQALEQFNRRLDCLAQQQSRHEENQGGGCGAVAGKLKVAPFSRLVGWTALAYCRLERREDALKLWENARKSGWLSDAALDTGMDGMTERLALKNKI
ncbi:hypothetical protein BX661DRAFT_188894 [Kickxella alabastrina]|uniref:uncharacterized protein n=1 Tax=Kickxella alabastrina TaxID=61397 RepID=UPI00221EA08F|nr:uncharacterized protein BX661DRAFT_188894 [Kickxella alabastrina]KAI7820736.1 hypothetical protein BX661DRAFT_188894 [Kickxella alabastrina]